MTEVSKDVTEQMQREAAEARSMLPDVYGLHADWEKMENRLARKMEKRIARQDKQLEELHEFLYGTYQRMITFEILVDGHEGEHVTKQVTCIKEAIREQLMDHYAELWNMPPSKIGEINE